MRQNKKIKNKKNDIYDISDNDEEIIPMNHDKIGNINFYSEEVVKQIIELLISYTITTNFRKNTEKKISFFCWQEIYHRLNIISELLIPNREIDDFNNSEYILSKIKYLKTDTNDKRYKINLHNKANAKKLIKIYEKKKLKELLNKSTNDNNDNNNNNKKDLIRNNNKQYNVEIKKYNYWGTITQPKTTCIDRTSSLYNNLNKNAKNFFEKKNIINDKNIKRKITSKKNTQVKQDLKETNDELNLINEKQKKKFQPILEMTYVELSKEEDKNQENEEIQKIRKETVERIEAKKEKKKQLEINLKLNTKKENVKGKYTTDVEGNIVMIKEILPENLLRDFYPINHKEKELLIGKTIEDLQNEQSLMIKNANKNIIFNEEEKKYSINLFNFNIIPNNTIIDNESEKDQKSNTKLIQLSKELINPFSLNFSGKNNSMEKIVLSGSNFKLINPSTGVNIKEQNQIKIGSTNFFKAYHKYSLDEYNQVLKNTLEKPKLSGINLNNNFTQLNNENNLHKDENNFDINKKNFNNINNVIKHKDKKIFRKTFSGNFRLKKQIQKDIKEIFTLDEINSNINLHQVLKNEDELNLYNEKKLIKTSSYNDIFRKGILTPVGRNYINKKKLKEFKFNLIDNFNKDLIMGYFQEDKEKFILPKLPHKPNNLNKLKNNTNLNIMFKTINSFYRTRQKRNNDLIPSLSSKTVRNKNNKKDKKDKI